MLLEYIVYLKQYFMQNCFPRISYYKFRRKMSSTPETSFVTFWDTQPLENITSWITSKIFLLCANVTFIIM